MKKVMMTVLVAVLFTAAAAVAPAWSQTQFSLNGGIQTNIWNGTSFDKVVFSLDARAGIHLGRSLQLSPEFMAVYNYASYFGVPEAHVWLLYPGVMLNYQAGSWFFGLGAVLPIIAGEGESDTGNVAPKINVGYKFGQWQVTAYMITWTDSGIDFLDVNWVGLTLGYRF
jgi:hypothetical protein